MNQESPKKHLSNYIKYILNKLPNNKAYMIVLSDYSEGHAIYFTKNTNQIFDNKEDLKKCLLERNGKRCHYMYFDNKQCAINCKKNNAAPIIKIFIIAHTK